ADLFAGGDHFAVADQAARRIASAIVHRCNDIPAVTHHHRLEPAEFSERGGRPLSSADNARAIDRNSSQIPRHDDFSEFVAFICMPHAIVKINRPRKYYRL
ncbi:MAG: hypothetical protein ACREEP_12350, partial [Dongiaceae bacterium]